MSQFFFCPEGSIEIMFPHRTFFPLGGLPSFFSFFGGASFSPTPIPFEAHLTMNTPPPLAQNGLVLVFFFFFYLLLRRVTWANAFSSSSAPVTSSLRCLGPFRCNHFLLLLVPPSHRQSGIPCSFPCRWRLFSFSISRFPPVLGHPWILDRKVSVSFLSPCSVRNTGSGSCRKPLPFPCPGSPFFNSFEQQGLFLTPRRFFLLFFSCSIPTRADLTPPLHTPGWSGGITWPPVFFRPHFSWPPPTFSANA